jgi:hypothetical protein
MGHHISAVVLKGSYDRKFAGVFDLKPIPLTDEVTLFPLYSRFVDHWAEKLGVSGFVDDVPLLNSNVVHHLVGYLAADPLFALVETDYFGGRGTQAAAVYRGKAEVMPPESGGFGPINKALQLLGVTAREGRDEFDTVGLGGHRGFDQLFKAYW